MKIYVFDSEVYKNYYCIGFKEVGTDNRLVFELPFLKEDKVKIKRLVKTNKIIGFNSINYDIPILSAALSGRDERQLKNISDKIIKNNIKWWVTLRNLNVSVVDMDSHIDLVEVAPGKASLKMYGGRLHSKRMQSLPIHFDAVLTDAEKQSIKNYMLNDLQVTEDLYNALKKPLDLRSQISKEIGVDVLSKSDAQIAESVFKANLPAVQKPSEDLSGWGFYYKVPKFIGFNTEQMNAVLNRIKNYQLIVKSTGKVDFPKDLTGYVSVSKTGIRKDEPIIELFGKTYKMGIGGLHSMEKSCSHKTTDTHFLCDHDVASYYPSIILNQGLYPPGCGPEFLGIYRSIYNQRLKAKAQGDKTTANTLKITLNGTFGKLGSKYSFLFAPELLIQTTLTGQLALLMLIEQFELAGIPVVSANTDGVVVNCPNELEGAMYDVILNWEHQTQFVTEETRYQALYSKDVNNYLAIKNSESYKAKGLYAPAGLMKNITNPICVKAVINLLQNGVPLDVTIKSSDDIRDFVTIRTVKGGAIDQDGNELGSAIRWYYGESIEGAIKYAVNGNKVPKTDGAKPCQELPDELPGDINYDWYIKESEGILNDIGYA